MESEKFETHDELLHFVLTECGDMTYRATISQSKKHESDEWDKLCEMDILSNFDSERFFYATELLKEQFGITIFKVRMRSIDFVEGWLSKTEITNLVVMLDMYTDIRHFALPDLPETIRSVFISFNWEDNITINIDDYKGTYSVKIYDMRPEIQYTDTPHRKKYVSYEFNSMKDALKYIKETIG